MCGLVRQLERRAANDENDKREEASMVILRSTTWRLHHVAWTIISFPISWCAFCYHSGPPPKANAVHLLHQDIAASVIKGSRLSTMIEQHRYHLPDVCQAHDKIDKRKPKVSLSTRTLSAARTTSPARQIPRPSKSKSCE